MVNVETNFSPYQLDSDSQHQFHDLRSKENEMGSQGLYLIRYYIVRCLARLKAKFDTNIIQLATNKPTL